MSVYSLPRNDIQAAISFYKERGSVTLAEMQTLLHLQDDPRTLMRLSKDWTIDVDSTRSSADWSVIGL